MKGRKLLKLRYMVPLLLVIFVLSAVLKAGSETGKSAKGTPTPIPSLVVGVSPSPTPSMNGGSQAITSPTPTTKPEATPEDSALPSTSPTKEPVSSESPASSEAPVQSQPPAGENTPNEETRYVALTFDDGPDAKYTPQVLDILKEHNVPATFFVVGLQVDKFPDMLNRIVDEGHIIGNHSQGHKDLTKLTKAQVQAELQSVSDKIQQAVGYVTPIFRAPFGARNKEVLAAAEEIGHTHVAWSVDTRDWAGTDSNAILDILKEQITPNGIVLMHSFGGKGGNLDNTIEALPHIIAYLKEHFYTFVTVPELLGK